MPIKVYVWLPQGDNLGHASMTLSDGTHISWWPGNKNAKKKSELKAMIISPAISIQTLEEDIELEGNIQPNGNYTLPVGFIDEDAISKWWGNFRPNGMYKVLDQNCCHVVFKALASGGAWKFITDEDVTGRAKDVLTPKYMYTLVAKLQKSLQEKKDKRR